MRSAGRDERTNEQCAGQHQTEGDGQLAESYPTAAFPINASYQSHSVSVDNGRGTSRTISLPSVSFGSQRTLSQAEADGWKFEMLHDSWTPTLAKRAIKSEKVG